MMKSHCSLFFLLMALPALLVEGQILAALKIPAQCGLHQHYDECGSACPTNCYNRFDTARACPKLCVLGCFCDEGYVFKCGKSGECVPESECQGICPENSQYKSCGSRWERKSCDDDPKRTLAVFCTLECVSGCFCNTGYVYKKGTSGPCVPPCDCPPKFTPIKLIPPIILPTKFFPPKLPPRKIEPQD
ncbi:inducible metalloproteinase inhibitor protein-like [Rhinatrema bivittatum]|uniref:inducible metalloproteinase inhibitor protein-like n=1 Tax=Rhinatrema bivittatum TaxID=194408 RepID=UPI0011278C22|nr:inducible metalloproteinase inhibitor protein-like [Rhinatrema bivittatum]